MRYRRWLATLATLLGLAALFAFLLTDSRPLAPLPRAATAAQVEVARQAFRELRLGRASGSSSLVTLTASDVDGISALVSQGFAPDRLDLIIAEDRAVAVVSRPVLGRWLNMRAEASGQSRGLPPLRVRVGSIELPMWASRAALQAARRIAILRGANLPPLDTLVQASRIDRGVIQARVVLPKTGLLSQVSAADSVAISDRKVARIYCSLARAQRRSPDPLFASQIRRAISASSPEPGETSAAMIALAIFVVDPRVGGLVGDAQQLVQPCLMAVPAFTLHGRTDLPKHWALSAALTLASGSRLAVAMGEWKELADSLPKDAYLTPGERTGFSLVDLAADRAGLRYARLITDPERLLDVRARMLSGADDMLLPRSQLALVEGLTDAEFKRRFGGTDDPRFLAAKEEIDADLRRAGIY